jgi:hypothetical protein
MAKLALGGAVSNRDARLGAYSLGVSVACRSDFHTTSRKRS